MCTALTFFKQNRMYFGRNLDLEYSFNEKVVVTPRCYRFNFKNGLIFKNKYAMIGMASVINNYPLYAEAINEKGLCLAGLNFPNNAKYYHSDNLTKNMIAPYELFPFILGQCQNLDEVKKIIKDLTIVDISFSKEIPNTTLHWMISDQNDKSIVIECIQGVMQINENPFGVLTNNPPFAFHKENVRQYLHLSNKNPDSLLIHDYEITNFCEGLGGIGLPGDFSSPSRFIKAFYLKYFSQCNDDELSCVSQVFHILDSVAMVSGAVLSHDNKNDITRYSCVMTLNGYYYKTYFNNQITKIELDEIKMSSKELFIHSLSTAQNILKI